MSNISHLFLQDAPQFYENNKDMPASIEVLEGESLFLNASAHGKPSDLTYVWMYEETFIGDERELNLSNILRQQQGLYTVEVSNIEGSISRNVSVQVKCKYQEYFETLIISL